MVWGIGDIWRFWMIPNWYSKIKGGAQAHLEAIWYHSEPSDVFYCLSQFLGWDFFVASNSKTALVFSVNPLNCEVVRWKICRFDSIEALAPFCYEQIHRLEKVNLVLYSWWFSTLLFPHWKLIEFSKRASNIWLKYLCVV